MTRKERLTRLYSHQEVDRPAVYSRTGFPANDPSYDRLKACLAEKTELKAHWRLRERASWLTENITEAHSSDFERHVTVIHTPKGDLRSTRLVSLKGQPGLHEQYLLKDEQDIEKYLSLPMPEIEADVPAFHTLQQEMGDKGIVEVLLGSNPGGFTAELFGSENFAMLTVTDRDLLYLVCRRQADILVSKIRFCAQNKLGPFFAMLGEEYIVPPLHGPADFQDFNVQFDKPLIDMVHQAGGRIHIHSHGSVQKVFQGFMDMGTDVLHPFEAPPSGDIAAREAKDLSRGKMCLEGNIQIAHMYEHTPHQVREETVRLIEDCFDDHKGLIVSPTASPYIRGKGEECFPQYEAMIDAVLDHAK